MPGLLALVPLPLRLWEGRKKGPCGWERGPSITLGWPETPGEFLDLSLLGYIHGAGGRPCPPWKNKHWKCLRSSSEGWENLERGPEH